MGDGMSEDDVSSLIDDNDDTDDTAASTPARPATARIVLAEATGMAIVMIVGAGAATVGIGAVGAGPLSVALAFGLGVMAATAIAGPVSGGHVNPAVTLALWLLRAIDGRRAIVEIIGQVIGAVAGVAVVWVIDRGNSDPFATADANFAANSWDVGLGFYGFWPTVIAEVVLTGVLVLVVLATSTPWAASPAAAAFAGAATTAIYVVAIPIDNASANPARSIASALFAGGVPLEQVWAFVVFPLIGSGLGAMAWAALEPAQSGSEASAA